MRIVIDMQEAQKNILDDSGKQTVSSIREFVRKQTEYEVILALNGLFPESIDIIRDYFRGLLPRHNIRIWHLPENMSQSGSEWELELVKLFHEAFIAGLEPDMVYEIKSGELSQNNSGEYWRKLKLSTNELIRRVSEIVPSNIPDRQIVNIAFALNLNRNDASKTLFVDISALAENDTKTGIQRVVRSILKEFMETPLEDYIVEPVYAFVDKRGYRYAYSPTRKDELIDYTNGDIFLVLDLHPNAICGQKDQLTTMHRDGVKVFFVVYDLLPVVMPEAFPEGGDKLHIAWLEVMINFDGAFCISRTVANELKQYFREHHPQQAETFIVDWFHLGADIDNSIPTSGLPDDAPRVLEELALRPTFVMIGTVEPRKGHAQAIEAFEYLWEKGLDVNLLVVGMEGWHVEDLARHFRQHPELNKRFFWLEKASDEYLSKIYAAGNCLIAASKGEGFGLPLIEAAQHELPVIARDIPVFREVAGEQAFYFKGSDKTALAEAIEHWLVLAEQGKAPNSEGMRWQTWKESAAQLWKCISDNDN